MKTKILLVLGFLALSYCVYSQDSPDVLIDKFFKDYKDLGAAKAVDNIYATNKWSLRFEDALNNLKKEFSNYNKDLVGDYYGFVFVTEKKLTDCFVLKSYLLKFDRQPLRLTFEFYKPNDKWFIYSLNIDTNFDDELEQLAKINLMGK